MIYVKASINDEIEIKVPIYGDCLFTYCGECGAEIQVDETFLADVINDGGDLAGTQLICEKCSLKSEA